MAYATPPPAPAGVLKSLAVTSAVSHH